MKRVCLIGSGNVAEALASALSETAGANRAETSGTPGCDDISSSRCEETSLSSDSCNCNDTPPCYDDTYRLVQLYARNRTRGEQLARAAGCAYTDSPEELAPADIYLIAVSDAQIAPLSESFDWSRIAPEAVVAHTAGSVPLEALSARIANRGVFYPLQTFTAGRRIDFRQVPLLVEGENAYTTRTLRQLAERLSVRVQEISGRQRAQLHLSAVFACNFTNHMYAVAQQLLSEQGLPPALLDPLIAETTAKAQEAPSAAAVQTGPARRGDRPTLQRHLELLKGRPDLQNLYETISSHIWETSKKI